MQKLVKGATKPKNTAPKAKYVEPILASTYEAGHDFEIVMESLAKVINGRNAAWPSIYKALIMVHIIIREGAEDVVLRYLARHSRMLDIEDPLHRGPAMGRYARYLTVRGQQFKDTNVDYIRYKTRQNFSRLHSLPVQKGLMRETSSVLVQLEALIKCQYDEQDIVKDDVLLMAFRLLVHDALSLFQVLNEGVINLLEHFFELSKTDAEQALDIYRGFRRLTAKVISYLRVAKNLEFKTMLHVPNIKHAPTSLVSSLEMYLNDPEFENNRRQYLAEKQAHNVKRSQSQSHKENVHRSMSTSSAPGPAPSSMLASSVPMQLLQPQQTQTIFSPVAAQPQQFAQSQQQQPPQVQQPQQVQSQVHQPLQTGQQQSDLANPFRQSQRETSTIQAADTQAQLQMQQLRQLQMQQVEQQERLRQQIAQLERQRSVTQQQTMQLQQPLQQQLTQPQQFAFTQQPLQQQPTAQYTQPLEQNHTGFEFGLGGQQHQAMQHYGQHSRPVQQPQQQQQQFQQHQFQPQQQQNQPPLQPQSTDYNPFKRTQSNAAPMNYAPLTSSETGTNPFKTNQFASQFSTFDQIGNQVQPRLIDFGQPQTFQVQTTGTNPFRT